MATVSVVLMQIEVERESGKGGEDSREGGKVGEKDKVHSFSFLSLRKECGETRSSAARRYLGGAPYIRVWIALGLSRITSESGSH